MMIHSFVLWGREACQQAAAGSAGPQHMPSCADSARMPTRSGISSPPGSPRHPPAQTLQTGRVLATAAKPTVQSPWEGLWAPSREGHKQATAEPAAPCSHPATPGLPQDKAGPLALGVVVPWGPGPC